MVERQFTTKLKNVQTDWGGKFRNLASFFSSLGIIHRRSYPHTSEQNGFVERRNRYVVETGLTLLVRCVPYVFGHYAFDTLPNGDALRKCILKGPYTPTIVTTPVVPATEDSPAVPEQTTVETTAQEMWEAIERLQQGESLNIQDVKTNLFWEFGQFTSHDGETIESYYTRFYKMMNEMIRNNLTVATMQLRRIKICINRDLSSHLQLLSRTLETYQTTTSELPNSRNKNWILRQGTSDEQSTDSLGNQRATNVAGDRETVVETGDSNVIPDSPDMCDNDIQNDQHDVECDDERVALANLIANLKLDVDDNKKIQKQLKKANATLTQELTECKSILVETSRTLGESNSIRDSCLVAPFKTNRLSLKVQRLFNVRNS
ncbi:retrovirus-related pol polyprotein from transposon TNT 1-94 [Tanacetum coccineum]|uniref:Retrovirus-related pol polyprotein from transposon TNT 1-94 n=1 Tax=Tanacetum coccineum TaxID=301880 RepID=A0ABQ5IY67_9ASTR